MRRLLTLAIFIAISLLAISQNNNEILTNLTFGRFSNALDIINKQEQTPEIMQYKAMAFEGLNLWDSAIACYSNLLYFDRLWAIKGLARCYENVGNAVKAIDYYRQILADDSTNINSIIRYANLLRCSSLNTQALEQYVKLVEIDSTNAKYWEMLGDQYKTMNMTIESTSAYYKAYELNHNNLFVASKYFSQLLKSNVPAQFIYENILDAYQVDSTYLPILLLKGKIEADMRKYKKAEITFTKITALGDSSFFTLKNLAIAKHSNGSYLEAEMYFRKAYEIDSTDYLLNYVYANTLLNVGERMLALDIINNTINRLYPPDELIATFYELIGDIYSRSNKMDLAVENYQLALEKDCKNDLKYINKIIWCKIHEKKFRDAEYFVHKYDSIASVKYATDTLLLEDAQNHVKYYKNILKKELFFLDDIKNGQILIY